ncbi:MAG: hypothetical protein M3Y56_12190 [Armatimonadota bacterium]|nr:hypothetical protein [Armatimonadota bacterium]
MLNLIIKINGAAALETCAVCGSWTELESGPELFLDESQTPVCWECGRAHALELVWMLERYREAITGQVEVETAEAGPDNPQWDEWPDPFQEETERGPQIRLG